MNDFAEQARRIAADFWTEDKVRFDRLAAEKKQGCFSDEYLAQREQVAVAARAAARADALHRLDALAAQIDDRLLRWDAPSAQALDSSDGRLLQSGIQMALAQFRVICRRNRDNGGLRPLLIQYATPRGWTAYVNADVPDATKRKAAAAKIITRARQDINAEDAGHAVASAPTIWAHYTSDASTTLGELSGPGTTSDGWHDSPTAQAFTAMTEQANGIQAAIDRAAAGADFLRAHPEIFK